MSGWQVRIEARLAIGLGFLLPLDLSFSCWFFYVLGKAVRVFGSVVAKRYSPKLKLQSKPDLLAQEMVDLVIKDVHTFVGNLEPYGDITFVVVRAM